MTREEFRKYYGGAEPYPLDPGFVEHIRSLASPGSDPDPERGITREEAEEDIRDFFDLLGVLWAGYLYYEDKVDFPGIRDGLISALPGTGTDTAALRERLYRALSPYITDTHFSFAGDLRFSRPRFGSFTGLTAERAEGGFRAVSCEGGEVPAGHVLPAEDLDGLLFPTLPGPDEAQRWLVGILSDAPPETLSVGGFVLPLHRCRTDVFTPPGVPFEDREVNGIPVVSDYGYGVTPVTEWYRARGLTDPFRETRGKAYADSPAVVWSLLGNRGGTSEYARQFIDGLNGYAFWECDCAVLSLDNPIDGQKNTATCVAFENGRIDLSQSRYGGRLYVLQNKDTASAGESAVKYAASVKGTVFVGSNTSGCGQFGDTRRWRLKRSGVSFRMGYKVFNMDGFEEGTGLLPDFWLDEEDPVSVLTAWMRERGIA